MIDYLYTTNKQNLTNIAFYGIILEEGRKGMATRILAVIHDDGDTPHCISHSNAILFEVAEGPHRGKRGCDGCLFELAGPIQWDKSQIVSYETGQKGEGIWEP